MMGGDVPNRRRKPVVFCEYDVGTDPAMAFFDFKQFNRFNQCFHPIDPDIFDSIAFQQVVKRDIMRGHAFRSGQ